MRMRKLPWAQDFLKEQEVVVADAAALAGAWKQTLKREELLLLHTALCQQRAKLGNTISELASFDLPTDDAQALANRLAGLSRRMCEALDR